MLHDLLAFLSQDLLSQERWDQIANALRNLSGLIYQDITSPRHLSDITPYRSAVVRILSVKAWANVQIVMSIVVLILAFAQKQTDRVFANLSLIGLMTYFLRVGTATFAVSGVWDGFWLYAHPDGTPRPFGVTAVCIVIGLQITQLVSRRAIQALVAGKDWPVAMMRKLGWTQDDLAALIRRHMK